MTEPSPHAKCNKGRPKYKWNLTSKQKYLQLACSAGYKTQTHTYCRCHSYKRIYKHCHVNRSYIIVMSGNNSDSSGQNNENAQTRQDNQNSNLPY